MIVLAVAGLVINATIPRGIRNNNPGNIRKNNIQWKGMSLIQSDPEFVRFKHPKYGVRAMAKILKSYQRRGLTTIRQVVNTYAPKNENDTEAYTEFVAEKLKVNKNEFIDVEQRIPELLKVIYEFENGQLWRNFYSDNTITEGMRLA